MNKTRKMSLVLVMIIAVMLFSACEKTASEKYYTVYFGLNDADAKTQKVSAEDAGIAIRKIITDKGFGYTEYTTHGAYVEDGEVCENDTLVYFLAFMDKDDVDSIVSKAKKDLNLGSVLIQESSSTFEFAK